MWREKRSEQEALLEGELRAEVLNVRLRGTTDIGGGPEAALMNLSEKGRSKDELI